MEESVTDAEADDEICQQPPSLGQAVVTQIVGQLGG
jgi:hypothetical protein